jgi:beta-galactosidase
MQPYSTEDLSLCTHNTDLEAINSPYYCLNIDGMIMGVGGDDSWTTCVHDDYLLHPDDEYRFELSFDFHCDEK